MADLLLHGLLDNGTTHLRIQICGDSYLFGNRVSVDASHVLIATRHFLQQPHPVLASQEALDGARKIVGLGRHVHDVRTMCACLRQQLGLEG